MLRNFLLIASRSFIREQVYAIVNLSSLVVGLTCTVFIFLWVMDELRYDRFHNDHERIYQVMENQIYSDGEILTYDATPAPLAEKLRAEFEEVELACHYSWPQKLLFTHGTNSIYQEGFYADANFFKLFTFPTIEGNPDTFLPDINSVVLTKRMAEKYFPGQSALGKVLRMNNDWDLKVTGVVKDDNSTIWFDYILPMALYEKREGRELSWNHHGTFNYVKLREGVDRDAFEAKIKTLLHSTHVENEANDLFLFSLNDWRLFWEFKHGFQTGGGRILYVIMFSLAAFFILIAACINFMNLATARAARRAKEVGVRKVAGASRKNLVQQFMLESLLLSFLSLAISLLASHLLTPLFNYLSGKDLYIDYTDPLLVGGLFGITLFAGLLSGSYPAFFLSSFRPASVLKGNLFAAQRGVSLRKGLVIFQFALSVVLIISALVINDQVQYIMTKNIGLAKDNVLFFEPRPGSLKNIESFKSELLQNPVIEAVGQGFDNPMNIYNNDMAQWDGIPSTEYVTVQTTVCDPDYINALGLNLLQGRHFSHDLASDSTAYIINETLARQMGFENPIGQRLKVYKTEGRVIGVVNDFHNQDFSGTIDPLIFVLGKSEPNPMSLFVRYQMGETSKTMAYLEKVYKKFEPTFPLEVQFLDRYLRGMYSREILTGRLSVCFMVIIIFISCLGLFGLTLYTTERRTKEIGVRKVLGASAQSLVLLLCKDFARPVLLSLVVGFPVAYYLMIEFLNRYKFHTELGAWVFLVTGAGVMLLATITVFYQSAKAAMTNPAETLRME